MSVYKQNSVCRPVTQKTERRMVNLSTDSESAHFKINGPNTL